MQNTEGQIINLETPYILYKKEKIKENIEYLYNECYEYFGKSFKLLYSIKANRNADVLEYISKHMDGFEISSVNELNYVKRFNKPIYCSIVSLKSYEIETLLSENIRINFDSYSSIINNVDILKGKRIGLRIKYKNSESRFGSYYTVEHIKRICEFGIIVERLHFHSSLGESIELILSYMKELISEGYLSDLKEIDFGGHWYSRLKTREHKDVFEEIKRFQNKHTNITVMFEPGQYIVNDSGFLVTSVIDIKQNRFGFQDLFLDTSVFNLFTWYTPRLVNGKSGDILYNICGNSMNEQDFFVHKIKLEQMNLNDKLLFYPVGAYCTSMCKSLHDFKHPKEYLV